MDDEWEAGMYAAADKVLELDPDYQPVFDHLIYTAARRGTPEGELLPETEAVREELAGLRGS